jgi:hypothetical protein
MDISLVPRHFPVQGDVSILPAVPPNACAMNQYNKSTVDLPEKNMI